MRVACNLLQAFRAPFEPERYQDGRREALLEVIAERRAGDGTEAKAAASIRDLMAALKASLEASGHKKRPRLAGVAGRKGPRRQSWLART